MLSVGAEIVLREILTGTVGLSELRRVEHELNTDFDDLAELAELLSKNVYEEELQKLFTERPQLLLGGFGYGQNSDVAFITKPQIGNKYRADFGVLSVDQGGCIVYLIELEPHTADLFTKKGIPAKTLNTAMGQINDWDQWIRPNSLTFMNDLIERTSKLPVFSRKSNNGSFTLTEPTKLFELWQQFGGFTYGAICYSIIIGRWSKLSLEHQKRLVYLNRQNPAHLQIRTYDQIARLAHSRRTNFAY